MNSLYLYIVGFIILFSSDGFSQLQGIGTSFGSTFSNLKSPSTEDSYSSETNQGLGGGIRLDFRMLDEYVMFSPEIFLQQKGSDEFIDDIDNLNLGKIDLSYLGMNLPIMIYGPMDEISEYSYNGIILQAKFYFDYFLTGSQTESGVSTPLKFDSSGDKFEYGYSLEGGFAYHGIQISFGYNVGLKPFDIIDTTNPDNTIFSVNNKGLFVAIGYAQKLFDDSY